MSVAASSWAWERQQLRPMVKFVLLALADFADKSGDNCFPGQKLLAQMTGLSERGVRGALAELESAGLIEGIAQWAGGHRSLTRYRLLCDPARLAYKPSNGTPGKPAGGSGSIAADGAGSEAASAAGCKAADAAGLDAVIPADGAVHTGTATHSIPANGAKSPAASILRSGSEIRSEIRKTQACARADCDQETPASENPDSADAIFEQAWRAYPKRAGHNSKAAARRAWDATLRREGKERIAGLLETAMLAGTQRYREFVAHNGDLGSRFVATASRFWGPDELWREKFEMGGNGGPQVDPAEQKRRREEWEEAERERAELAAMTPEQRRRRAEEIHQIAVSAFEKRASGGNHASGR